MQQQQQQLATAAAQSAKAAVQQLHAYSAVERKVELLAPAVFPLTGHVCSADGRVADNPNARDHRMN